MNKIITSFVGLDVHQDSTAIGVAEAEREAPRFLGTVGPPIRQPLVKWQYKTETQSSVRKKAVDCQCTP